MADELDEQPEAGQDAGSSSGLYPDLSALDEQTRATVEPLFKEWDANVTRKLTEAADYRKQWEPLSELGVQDMPVEDLQRLIAFREIAGDEQQFRQWWQSVGQEMGLLDQPDPVEDPAEVQTLIEQALAQRLAPIESAFAQQQQLQAQAQAEEFVNSALDTLAKEHGEFDRDAVCQLALAYDGADAVQQGFADYQRIVGTAEKGVLQQKVNAPAAPESGGTAATQVKPVTDFAEAKELARAYMRGNAST